MKKYILLIVLTLLLNMNHSAIDHCYPASIGSDALLYQDYILYWEYGKINLDRVDIKNNSSHVVAKIYIKEIPGGIVMNDDLTISSDQKRVLFTGHQFEPDMGNRLCESELINKTLTDYFPPPVDIVFPRLSQKDYIAFLSFVRPPEKGESLPYYNLSYCTSKNDQPITFHPPFWVKHYRPPSWNSESNLIAVSDRDDNIYIFELNGKYHFICKGYLGTFSPINSNQIVVIDSSRESLILITFDKDFNIISRNTLVHFALDDVFLPIFSQDGKRIYYLSRSNSLLSWLFGGAGRGGIRCVDINTKTIYSLDPSPNWSAGCTTLQPTRELLEKISNKY